MSIPALLDKLESFDLTRKSNGQFIKLVRAELQKAADNKPRNPMLLSLPWEDWYEEYIGLDVKEAAPK